MQFKRVRFEDRSQTVRKVGHNSIHASLIAARILSDSLIVHVATCKSAPCACSTSSPVSIDD